jgi:hypothetical protein
MPARPGARLLLTGEAATIAAGIGGNLVAPVIAGVLWRARSDIAAREPGMAHAAAVAIGIVATAASILIGTGFNITFLLGLAFLVAASANLPVLLCTLFRCRFNRAGAAGSERWSLKPTRASWSRSSWSPFDEILADPTPHQTDIDDTYFRLTS